MSDPIEAFRLAIEAAGFTPPDTIHDDGAIHRFSTNGRHSDNSGYYMLHTDGIPAGSFGCWRAGLQSTWCSKADSTMTTAEREAHRKRIKTMRAQRDAEQAQRQKVAGQTATALWQHADPATAHPYLTTKAIQPHGIKTFSDKLLIPMRDTAGTLHSLQTIAPDGGKLFHPGGRVKGCYFGIGKPAGRLIVCEGFATGASIHEATGQAVAVAFNAGNLEAVALALLDKYPALQIVIAADDDHRTDGNPGMTKATAAAQAVGGLLAAPVFPGDRPDKATDFNDLYRIGGLDAVRHGIESAVNVPNSTQNLPNKSAGPTYQPLDDRPTTKRTFVSDGVVLVCGDSLIPQPIAWLWHGWLALGKFHLLAGAPGQGKTTIAIAFAATITIGGRWPDGSRCDAGNVLIWSGEDDPADTLLPRLLAAGGERSRIFFVEGTRTDGVIRSFDPALDMAGLQAEAKRIGNVQLIIVDPVVSAVTGDSHKNTETRRALQPLVDLASNLNAALVGITHFSKGGQGSDPAQRVIGSVAFSAVARVVLVAAKVRSEDGEDRRILARGKSNIGPDDGGFTYSLEQCEALPNIQASRVIWGASVEGSARELLSDPNEQDGDDGDGKSATEGASDFLRDVLADGPVPSREIQRQAREAGVSWRTVRRASDDMQIIKKKGLGDSTAWHWKLCKLAKTPHVVQPVQPLELDNLDNLSDLDKLEGGKSINADSEDAEVF